MKIGLTILGYSWLALTLHAADFRAGIAVRNITPQPLLPVSGGVGPSHATTRKQGELTVRALVLSKGETRVAIVSADVLGFPAVLGNRVRAMVPEIPASHILIGATHTHSAPDCYGFPDEQGKFTADLNYLDSICQRMAEAIRDALHNARRAKIKIATGEARGRIAYNYYAEQLYDPRCHVIQAVADDGQPIATLVNYAIHPEVLGSDQGILSPDLVGPLYDRIQTAGGGTAIFMNSAQGGMVTADNRTPQGGEARTWEECARIGTLLADEALRLVKKAPVQTDPDLFCQAQQVTFPVDSPLLRAILQNSPLRYADSSATARRSRNRDGETARRRDGVESSRPASNGDDMGTEITTQINVVNLGNAQILTIPGEALPNIGYYLKRKMRGEHNLLFGLTNDAFGYILTKVDWGSFKRYDYVTRTCLGEMTGEILIEAGLRLVNQCPRPQSKLQLPTPK